MKLKKICLFLYLLTIFLLFNPVALATLEEKDINEEVEEDSTLDLAKNASGAIMIESSTGKIIFKKNENEKMAPASMTKMMSLLLIMEEIEEGRLSLEDKVTASVYASSMGGSQIFLKQGEVMTVNDLLKGIAIGSGNDATVAMAEKIAGTEENFVKMMNKRAIELGCKNTSFKNATGLDAENHYSTAYDMALIARELVKHEKILEYTSTYEDYLRKDTSSPFWLVNTNKLVRFYQEVDGLKTGYTKEAGYCLTATAKKNDMRLITVVMNEESSQIRNSETIGMLDYGFNMYKITKILDKSKVIQKSKVELGEKEEVEVIPLEDVNILNSKNDDYEDIKYEVKLNKIVSPVKVGDIVGEIEIILDGKVINTIDVTVGENVDKASIFKVYYRNIKKVLKGF